MCAVRLPAPAPASAAAARDRSWLASVLRCVYQLVDNTVDSLAARLTHNSSHVSNNSRGAAAAPGNETLLVPVLGRAVRICDVRWRAVLCCAAQVWHVPVEEQLPGS
jgi:hypothetical protein